MDDTSETRTEHRTSGTEGARRRRHRAGRCPGPGGLLPLSPVRRGRARPQQHARGCVDAAAARCPPAGRPGGRGRRPSCPSGRRRRTRRRHRGAGRRSDGDAAGRVAGARRPRGTGLDARPVARRAPRRCPAAGGGRPHDPRPSPPGASGRGPGRPGSRRSVTRPTTSGWRPIACPTPAAARAVEQYLVATVDHGFNASTFTGAGRGEHRCRHGGGPRRRRRCADRARSTAARRAAASR